MVGFTRLNGRVVYRLYTATKTKHPQFWRARGEPVAHAYVLRREQSHTDYHAHCIISIAQAQNKLILHGTR